MLLVNTASPVIQEHEILEYAEEHHPLLAFDTKNLQGVQTDTGGAKAIWTLDFENIRVYLRPRGGGDLIPCTGGIRVIKGTRDGDVPDPGTDEEKDITWVPQIRQVLPEASAVDPDYMDETTNYEDMVIGRVILQEGWLMTDSVAYYKQGGLVAQFAPLVEGSSFPPQAVAHWVALELPDIRDDLEVVVRAQKMNRMLEETREVALTPAARENRVEVEVTNLCCGYYFNYLRGYSSEDYELPEEDYDFQLLYALSENFDDVSDEWLPIPVPVKAYPPQEGGGVDPLRCTMTFFDPYARRPVEVEEHFSAVANSPESAASKGVASVLGPLRRVSFSAAEQVDHDRFDFPIQEQPPRSELCWAAVAASVDDHFRMKPWEQCEIAAAVLDEGCSCAVYPGTPCNRPSEGWKALASRMCFAPPVQASYARFEQIVSQVALRYPIVASTEDHVVVVHGWIDDGRKQQIEISDPLGGHTKVVRYRKKPRVGTDRWRRTYFTTLPS